MKDLAQKSLDVKDDADRWFLKRAILRLGGLSTSPAYN